MAGGKKLDTNDVCETVAVFSNKAMRMRILTHPAYTYRLIVACSQYVIYVILNKHLFAAHKRLNDDVPLHGPSYINKMKHFP